MSTLSAYRVHDTVSGATFYFVSYFNAWMKLNEICKTAFDANPGASWRMTEWVPFSMVVETVTGGPTTGTKANVSLESISVDQGLPATG